LKVNTQLESSSSKKEKEDKIRSQDVITSYHSHEMKTHKYWHLHLATESNLAIDETFDEEIDSK